MKILVVSQYFWPENFRINDLCSELVERGHEVVVLTGKPNYPGGVFFEEYCKEPESYREYNRVRIVRTPLFPRGRGGFRLLLNYLSFVVSATTLGWFKLRADKFDVIFVYEPSPVTVCLPAIFIKTIKKIPIVFWVQDLWPETLEAIGVVKSKRLLALVGSVVRFIYKHCDLILGQSKAFYEGIAKYCEDKDKIGYFPNWSENVFNVKNIETVESVSKFTNTFKVLFAGNMGDAQDFPAILNAASILKEQGADAKIFIVGDGRAYGWVKSEIADRGLGDYVVLLGRHPLDSMPGFYTSADALLATLKKSPVFEKTIPSKVQSYMSAAKPILTMMCGEGSRIVLESGSGYVAESGDYKQLAENIIQMSQLEDEALSQMGRNAEDYALSEFDRGKLISELEDIFMKIKL